MENATQKPILLVALGGNALIHKGQVGNIQQQLDNLRVPIRQIARLSRHYKIIITHGNGPQVGNLLLQQEKCHEVPQMPLEILVAQTQGQIGYMIESTLDTALMEIGIEAQKLVSLISYVVVDENDPAFLQPSKPIGPTYQHKPAETLGYQVRQTEKGYRQVVVSPEPVSIVEKKEIKELIERDFIVICCGGGGIPVVREGRAFNGIPAVIDKDLASAKLAEEVGVDILVIATDVPGVFYNYAQPNESLLNEITLEQAEQYLAESQFSSGSMAPKVKAACRFLQSGGRRAVITSIKEIESAITGKSGTEFIRKE